MIELLLQEAARLSSCPKLPILNFNPKWFNGDGDDKAFVAGGSAPEIVPAAPQGAGAGPRSALRGNAPGAGRNGSVGGAAGSAEAASAWLRAAAKRAAELWHDDQARGML